MKKWFVIFTVCVMVVLMGCSRNTETGSSTVDTTASSSGESTSTKTEGTTTSADAAATTTIGKKPQGGTTSVKTGGSTPTTSEYVPPNTATTFKRVTPVRSAKDTAAMINNNLARPATKIVSEKSTVWYPKSANEWTYSHHASTVYFKGKLYVMFSNGRVNEDDCGQRIMISSSSDFKTWSTPKALPYGDTERGEYADVVKLAGRIYAHNGKMYATFSSSEYKPDNMQGPNLRPYEDEPRINYKNYIISTTDGVNWKLEGNKSGGINGQPTWSGRYFLPGLTSTMYTDDPSGLSGFDVGSMPLSNMDSIMKEYNIKLICEGTYYQTKDGIVRLMWRTDSDYMLMAESYNNGLTWTRPYMTKFKNGYSKFKFGYLPDGRYFCIYNPTGYGRNPLSIVLSDDGINFNTQYTIRDEVMKQQFKGLWKGGTYAYPEFDIANGYMYIAYSIEKEGIEVTRIKLSDLK